MFFAVALFVILLLGLLYIAFMRFGDPPPPAEAEPAAWNTPTVAPHFAGQVAANGIDGTASSVRIVEAPWVIPGV